MQGLKALSFDVLETARWAEAMPLNLTSISGLTQLQSLSIGSTLPCTYSCADLTNLTGLTSLHLRKPVLRAATPTDDGLGQQQHQEEGGTQQQSLQIVLSQLTSLRELELTCWSLPAGFTDVVAQLTQLTSLRFQILSTDSLWYAAAQNRPVMLPWVKKLSISGDGALQFLNGTHLPVLAQLEALHIKAGVAAEQRQLVERSAKVLQLCSSIELTGEGQDVSGDELGTVLAALTAAWQQGAPTKRTQGIALQHLHCTAAALSKIPSGSITFLKLM
jgi:hypothetical protein